MGDLVVFRFSDQGSTNWQASLLPVTALDIHTFWCTMRPMKRYNFFLPDSIVATLRVEAERTGLTMSELIRKALTVYTNKLAEKHAQQ